MRRRLLIPAAFVAALPLVPQAGPPASRPGAASRTRAYEAARETDMHGIVQEVLTVARGRSSGVHLKLTSDGKAWDVHLAPAWYLEKHQWRFAKGDELDVLGAKAGPGEGSYIIAREVKRRGEILVLRDAAGLPRWSRRGPTPR